MLDSALPDSSQPAAARNDDRVSPAPNAQSAATAERPRDTAPVVAAEPSRATSDVEPATEPKDATKDESDGNTDAAVDPAALLADPQVASTVDPNAANSAAAAAATAPQVTPTAVVVPVLADASVMQVVPAQAATIDSETAA